MTTKLVSILLLAVFSSSLADPDPGEKDTSCPGGYRNGQTFHSTRYWYQCVDGTVVPKGCLATGNDAEIPIQGTFDVDGVRMQCVQEPSGYLSILYKSCVHSGSERQVNDRWDDGSVYYTCKKDGSSVRTERIGCVYQGRQLTYGEKVANGDSVYECRQSSSGQVEMGKNGCAKDGTKYAVGQTYETGSLWYTCTDHGGEVTGCVHGGRQYQDGDRFRQNDMIFQCRVNGERTGPEAFACIAYENGVEAEKKFDCFWHEDGYEMTCKYEASSNLAVKVRVRPLS